MVEKIMDGSMSDLLQKIVNFIVLGLLGWMAITLLTVRDNQIRMEIDLSYLNKSVEKMEETRYTKADSIVTSNRISNLERTVEDVSSKLSAIEKKIGNVKYKEETD